MIVRWITGWTSFPESKSSWNDNRLFTSAEADLKRQFIRAETQNSPADRKSGKAVLKRIHQGYERGITPQGC